MTVKSHKKLIEVALPLQAINEASAREKSIRHGHPSTLHLWWARRPLAAARAVIFAQMVDDPSAHPDLFPTEKKQEKERQRLFKIIEELVKWENTTNEEVLQQARDEIWQSWRYACAENIDHPRAKELFDRFKLPAFHDPFAGGGALPLEAQRLGLEAYASDLNPVAVLINKAMIEIPPKFAGMPPVNPAARSEWRGVRSEIEGKETTDALSGNDFMAESDGDREGSLPSGPPVAKGGNLRDAVTDNARGGIRSGKHRGRVDTGDGQGQGALFGHRSGVTGGDRDITNVVRGPELVSEKRHTKLAPDVGRGKQNIDDHAQETTPGLTSSHSSLLSPHTSSPSHSSLLFPRSYSGAQGLAEDVRYYGQWMRDEAEKRIGRLYPKIEITAKMATERKDLKTYVGDKLTVIAWLWARTVKSPNPAFAKVDVPLASTFMLSTKAGKEAYVEPVIEDGSYRFTVKVGKPRNAEAAKMGTTAGKRHAFLCLMSGTPIDYDYIRNEGKAGRMGAKLMAIVAEGERGRVYLSPTPEHDSIARKATPEWEPENELPDNPRDFKTPNYGLSTFGDLFTPRQLVALTTFSDLVQEARERVKADILLGAPSLGTPASSPAGASKTAHGANKSDAPLGAPDPRSLDDGGAGPAAYADAVAVYLAFAVDKCSDYWSGICSWHSSGEKMRNTFGRQAIPMVWDYAECNPLCGSTGNWMAMVDWTWKALITVPAAFSGYTAQADAQKQIISADKVVSSDPPYYDNIGYADLSDFFYVWLRRSLKPVFPDLFATLEVPKAQELVATPYRHGSKKEAEAFFLVGMSKAVWNLCEQAHPAFPVTIYYAFKQSETREERSEGREVRREKDNGAVSLPLTSNSSSLTTTSTGWETFLDAVISAGFAITGTWPMRTELGNRMISSGTNALASSIVLVCRKRAADAPEATRREFVAALKAELPGALRHLQAGNIAPVDLAQAAIGPGMGVFSRYARVVDTEGRPVPVREALALINQTLDEALAEQEGDFDADSRWALAWFEQHGFGEGEYGVAETLSKAKNTSVSGLAESGIIESKRGRVCLLRPDELSEGWDPATDKRLNTWEMVHRLIRALETGGESAAADLVSLLGAKAETARELAYRLYTLCERKKRANEALSYNGLVQSWPELLRLAKGTPKAGKEGDLFG